MDASRSFRIVQAASAAARLAEAASFLRQFPPDQPVTIVSATRGAADDLARRMAVERGAILGLARFSLTQLAARVAVTRLAGEGIAAATTLGGQAISARATFDASREGSLTYLAGVATAPGFPRALAHTLAELGAAGVTPDALAQAGRSGPDLARLLTRARSEYDAAATADRARLFVTAAAAVEDVPELHAPLLLLDVGVRSAAEWQPEVDPHVMLLLLAGALGVTEEGDDTPPPKPGVLARHAALLTAGLLGPRPARPFLDATFTEIERAQLND